MDAQAGMERVVVVGSSCAGKSTLARRLASALDSPHVELDDLNWQPGWTEVALGELRDRVSAAAASDRWVIDGNYQSRVADITWPRATAFVWLNYSRSVVAWRALSRSVRRLILRERLWSSGNRESFRRTFMSSDSILLWVLRTHGTYRREFGRMFLDRPHPGARGARSDLERRRA